MNCSGCGKDIVSERLFCTRCGAFILNPQVGKKASLFRRWVATVIDPVLAVVLYFFAAGFLGGVAMAFGMGATLGAIIIVTIGYGIFYLNLLKRGMTPGKWLLSERVVESISGNYPGLWRMILREIIGKFVSGLFFGLGYFWAIWDRDGQAWHDKIAVTVVVQKR
ncbi:MAG TPA: hypothetical protein DEV73_03000 [Candidatus Zambryskibacteria bacterium]|nr:hypothetical protein [Candidatus Zambryskibacteria bacterium]